ncbi:UNVERIFIED_CONTAM: hypothetical protein Sradi_1627400 [Sesamum radiatum]|uniref:Uncharacterized protein n=1 Tax=Sesamum radiatum TaxID=300843 RepID=A0AAW2UD16_SESRA
MDTTRNSLESDVNSEDLEGVESPEVVRNGESDVDDESQALLRSQESKVPKMPEKPRRKVQWLDRHGDKLAQILEFQPR